jgi:hypothetical protein
MGDQINDGFLTHLFNVIGHIFLVVRNKHIVIFVIETLMALSGESNLENLASINKRCRCHSFNFRWQGDPKGDLSLCYSSSSLGLSTSSLCLHSSRPIRFTKR